MFVVWAAALAVAQTAGTPEVPQINSQLYRPPVDARSTLWTEATGGITSELSGTVRFASHYVNRPLVYLSDEPGADQTVLVSDLLQVDAIAAGHLDRFRLALDIPLYLYQAGQLTDDGPGIGDIALDGRATLFDRDDAPLGLALFSRLTVPTSSVPSSLGYDNVTGEIGVGADREVAERVMVAANLATRFVPSQDLDVPDDEFIFRLGGGYGLTDDAGLSADLVGRTAFAALDESSGTPVEALLGGWGRIDGDWVLRGGLGRGLSGGIGSPQARVVAMLTYDPPRVRDRDGDGLVDRDDVCPDEPEDADGYADTDGCPDPSHPVSILVRNADGNALPLAKVSLSGPEPQGFTGSADLTLHEGEYVASATAFEYNPAEVGFVVPVGGGEVVLTLEPSIVYGKVGLRVNDENGDPIADATWQIDGADGPPVVDGAAEVKAEVGEREVSVRAPGFRSERFTPTVEKDQTVNLVVTLERARVVVTKERIDIKGTIYFETAKAVIKAESHDLLDEVATNILDHPEIAKVRIEGHTDTRGSAAYNKKLSDERAAAVKTYLVEHGVEEARLSSIGYGEERPVDNRNTAAAHDKNRRVDFFIEERSDD